MKIIELLTNQEKDRIRELISSYGPTNEFEASLFSNRETSSNLLTLEKFNNLNSVLAKITEKNEEKYKSKSVQMLDIIFSIHNRNGVPEESITNYRITIVGLEMINKYLSMLHMRKNHLVISVLASFYVNTKASGKESNIIIMKKIKNVSKYVTLEEIYMRIKMDVEISVTDNELQKLMELQQHWEPNDYTIFYRYKERTTYYIKKEANLFLMDLTTTKMTNQINKIEMCIPKYEIEIECEIENKNKLMEQLFQISEFVIKSIQGSNHIITKSNSENVLAKYREIMNVTDSITNLYARQPISMEVQHLVDYLPNKYSVTDKADGDRNFLIIVDGRCYLISTNLIVRDTGLDVNPELNGTILDGEIIFLSKYNRYIFMGFDCIWMGNINVKEEAKLFKRLEYLDQIVYAINDCKYKHKSVYDSGLDFNQIEQVCEFHKQNLIDFYADIDLELKKKSNTMLIRRKYFMESLGIQDNEIFKYTWLLWNMITTNPEIKYPYMHDGLIFHPNEQKYVVDVSKSKYPEYKLKPPKKNSIDLYTIFEKDKNTGKILVVYDNSIDGVAKNKPYLIANLYVGLFIKDVEKPVLFGEDYGVSQAYIYLDGEGIARSIDGKPLMDKTVIEYYYNLESEFPNSYRWVPMKTRWDKTESVIKYGRRYGNAQRTANAVWRSITNPILMSDFNNLSSDTEYTKYYKIFQSKIDFSVIKMEKRENVYFQKKSNLVKEMSNFHNWIKSNLLYTYMTYKYNDNVQCKVLDLGCGRGADIPKYYYTEVEMVVGVDPDYDAIIDSSDGATARYNAIKRGKDRFPPMSFVHANSGIYLQYDEQIKSLGKMNQEMKKTFERFFTWDNKRTIFDRVNCQFVIHYLLSDESTWNNYCENINMYLRDGGYFVFTTFDGNKVKQKLANQSNYIEYYNDNGEKKILFDIVKKYNDNSTSPFSNAIDVHMGWIFDEGVYQTEYLVYPEFIINSLKEKCSMELVETCTFEEIFNDNMEFIKLSSEIEKDYRRIKFFQDVYKYYTPNEINSKCYGYTFLNRFYIFRKKEMDLNEVKEKYYGPDRKRIIKTSGTSSAKSKVEQKKKIMQEETKKEVSKIKKLHKK